jgi:LuxR family maltose regulon positive regulatory protein
LTAEQLPTAWVSLDADDNDPIRFWLYLGASLDALEPALGASVCELLRSPQPPPLPSVVIMLCNALTTLARKCVLVLDDYHVISAPQIHEGLAFLLEHLPPQVHLVLMTRGDPPLPLARLRARGQLSELRSADLRFRLDEAAAFLNAIMGLDLGPDDLTALDAQTEGWIAGLQLAALSLRGRPDASRFIAAFVGSHRFLLDYLSEEVLSRQPQAVQDFLLRTALLDRLSASLCNALTGRDDGQAMLEHLERANLFLIPLDDEQCWYRYHHLFGEFLRDRLRSASANLLPELYQRASALCEREGLLDEAVGYALSAAQLDTRLTAHAADLIERVGYTVWMSGATGTISTWLDRLPIAVVRSRPMLCLARA